MQNNMHTKSSVDWTQDLKVMFGTSKQDEAAADAAAAERYHYMSPFQATLKWNKDKISYFSAKGNITFYSKEIGT